nr:hypothetical protein MarFTME_495 [Marseillevirus futianmevirus]
MDVASILFDKEELAKVLGTEKLWIDKEGCVRDDIGRCFDVCVCVARQGMPKECISLLLKHKIKFLTSCGECSLSQEGIIPVLLSLLEEIC